MRDSELTSRNNEQLRSYSGCTGYMLKNSEPFSDLDTIRVGVEGNANSSRSRIDGHGTAEFWVDDSAGRERHLKLKDASYVPSYSHNLVTVSNLNTNGAVATKTRRGSR